MKPRRIEHPSPTRQRGAIAVVMGLSLAVMLAAVGLAVDGGRLYANKSELQTAADACALAAVRELKCDSSKTCARTYLTNAKDAGIYAASRNKAALQASTVTVPPSDVTFSTQPTSGFADSTSADTKSAYVKCVARATGITPWLMGAVGVGNQSVSASAVAALTPTQRRCITAPMAVCTQSGQPAPHFGYTTGRWIAATLNRNGSSSNYKINGNTLQWLNVQHALGHQECAQDDVDEGTVALTTTLSSTDYNARFGLYTSTPSAATLLASPPDINGYAYPNKATSSLYNATTGNAYADYVNRQGSATPFTAAQYAGDALDSAFKPITSATHQASGHVRRLVLAPLVDCAAKSQPAVQGIACLLLINPIGGVSAPQLYAEYLGNAAVMSTPCGTFGYSAGANGNGARAATLIQ